MKKRKNKDKKGKKLETITLDRKKDTRKKIQERNIIQKKGTKEKKRMR